MNILLHKAKNTDFKQIKQLYNTAFPKDERVVPFYVLKNKAKLGKGELITVKIDGKFVGFASVISHCGISYLFYFAITKDNRGKGYGSVVLSELKKIYKDNILFLAREQLDENADNYNERIKRHNFYLNNGFSDWKCKIKEANVVYDVMGVGSNEVDASQYEKLMKFWAGKLLYSTIGIKMFTEYDEGT